MNELELLRVYIESAEPSINRELREGYSPNAALFDTLFVEGEIPDILYRLIPNENVHIIQDNTICAPAYLSCTNDVDNYIGRINSEHLACIKIATTSPMHRIIVNHFFPNHNEEGEIILPRNLRLRITNHQIFEGVGSFAHFIEIVDSEERPETLSQIYHYSSIHLYEVELATVE